MNNQEDYSFDTFVDIKTREYRENESLCTNISNKPS